MNRNNVLKVTNLVVFNAIVEAGSISLAAKELNRSQGQLSQVVSAIEGVCGCLLLKREATGVSLTPAGVDFVTEMHKYLNAYHTFTEKVSAFGAQEDAAITLSAPPGFIHYISLNIIPLLAERYPDTPIVMMNLKAGNVEDYDHVFYRSDIIISFVPSQQMTSVNQFFELEMGFYVAPDFSIPTGIDHPTALVQLPCITIENYGSNSNAWSYLSENSVEQLNVTSKYQCNDVASAIAMGINGLGVIYIPKIMADEAVQAGRLTAVLPEFNCKKPVYVIYKKDRFVKKDVPEIYSLIVSHAKNLNN